MRKLIFAYFLFYLFRFSEKDGYQSTADTAVSAGDYSYRFVNLHFSHFVFSLPAGDPTPDG
jgi:hypothetical protein